MAINTKPIYDTEVVDKLLKQLREFETATLTSLATALAGSLSWWKQEVQRNDAAD